MKSSKPGKRQPGRDERGHFLPRHGLGGRPKGPEKLSTAFHAAGTTPAAARLLLMQKTLELARRGDREALARLDRWTMPRDRPVAAGMFKDAKNALERAAALREALDAGELSPTESALVTRTLEHEASAGEYRDLADKLAALEAAGPTPALPPRTVRVVTESVTVRARADGGPAVIDVEPSAE